MNAQYEEKLPYDFEALQTIGSINDFDQLALAAFRYQLNENKVYKAYCEHLKVDVRSVDHYTKIPFLPISFFKTHDVQSFKGSGEVTFTSSGTTGMQPSRHTVYDLKWYENSFNTCFERFYGNPKDYIIIGLLPSYLEREGSSLVYMVDQLIQSSAHPESGFFLDQYEALNTLLLSCQNKKVLLIGVAYALLDFGEKFRPQLNDCIIMETGGMKGKRKELIKEDLHRYLQSFYPDSKIHSEYGMTELLSQAYSEGTKFRCPPWMKVLTRSYSDPFQLVREKTGGINVIDLANIHSCCFIATQDLGKVHSDYFEVLGRFDNADIRGCNLLVQ